MFTRNVGRRERAGTAMPLPFNSLASMGVQVRQSELTLVAGQPGAGKSSLALSVVLGSTTPALYVCADTSEQTVRTRAAAMLTGLTQDEAERRMYSDVQWATKVFQRTQHVAWTFDPTPSLHNIEEDIAAYEEVHGTTPSIIVVDNLIDVAVEGSDEWGGLRQSVKHLKNLARAAEAAVIVLHHTSEAVHTMGIAPPRSSIQGKVSQLPALILTVEVDSSSDLMGVAVVKNRFGKADASGAYGVWLEFDPGRMLLRDVETNMR